MNKLIILCLVFGLFAFAECRLPCATEGKMCAGFAGIQCCEGKGLRCYGVDPKIADAAGTCVTGCRREGEACGGIAGIPCCDKNSGSKTALGCHITATYPDAMGKCVRV